MISEYVGCGDVGATLAEIDNLALRERQAARNALGEEAERAKELDGVIGDLYRAAEQAATEALVEAGFHQHKRQWRRRRRER